ncbi:MAG TPA: EAL domain-containing protein [Burkholderiales bacterium]
MSTKSNRKRTKPAHPSAQGAPLQLRLNQLEFVHRSASIVSWVWDLSADRVEWFGDIDKLLGLAPGRFSGRLQDYLERLHPGDVERVKRAHVESQQGRYPRYRSEERVLLPDGNVRWLERLVEADYGTDGRAVRMSGVVQDLTERVGAFLLLQQSERKFGAVFETCPEAISITSASDAKIIDVNAAWMRAMGYEREAALGRSALELGMWEHRSDRDRLIEQLHAQGSVSNFECRFVRADGRTVDVLLSSQAVQIDGEPCLVHVWREITERKRTEELISSIARGVSGATGEPFFHSLIGQLSSALGADFAFVGELDPKNPAWVSTVAAYADGAPVANFRYALRGSPCENVVGQRICVYPNHVCQSFPDDPPLAQKSIEAYVGAPLMSSSGQALGLIAVMFRAPLREAALAEQLLKIFAMRASGELERLRHVLALEHLATHDTLTGLPNRMLLKRRVDESVGRMTGAASLAEPAALGEEPKGLGALMLIDLDRFKEVNDTLGHHVGDELLKNLIRRRSGELYRKYGAEFGRLGGDEFALWVPGLDDARHAGELAAQVRESIIEPVEVEGYHLQVDSSIGIAMYPAHARDASGLLRCADVAMYNAKRSGTGWAAYDPSADPHSVRRLAMMSDLGAAVRSGQLLAHYQPRVRLSDGHLQGFEALVRWRHPTLGLIPPAQFIPLAELSDVIRPLTLYMLDAALAHQRTWRDLELNISVAVNLSPRHLIDEAFPEQIGELIARHDADPATIELEITEGAIISDPDRATRIIRRIYGMGVRLSVDDFGTGFSSLSRLRQLPLHGLKIDLSFVAGMTTNEEDATIVKSIVDLAHNLGMLVIAEGVENKATLDALGACGCDEAQGYLIGRPMEPGAVRAWVYGWLERSGWKRR